MVSTANYRILIGHHVHLGDGHVFGGKVQLKEGYYILVRSSDLTSSYFPTNIFLG
jgi:acetyltransferase-like isoleucine patch superfamily enzyme